MKRMGEERDGEGASDGLRFELKSEGRNPNPERNPKSEIRKSGHFLFLDAKRIPISGYPTVLRIETVLASDVWFKSHQWLVILWQERVSAARFKSAEWKP